MKLTDLMPGGGTFVPNCLLDELLPDLRDTELRVLLVVCRQTVGRADRDGRRRRSDWISQRQLMRRTGRASAAVSRAVDSLVRKGLLMAEGPDGAALATTAARRSAQGGVRYSLAPRALRLGTPAGGGPPAKSSESEPPKANATKQRMYKRKNMDMDKGPRRSSPGWSRASAVAEGSKAGPGHAA